MVQTEEQYLYLLKRIGRWPDEKLINYMLKKFTFTYQLNQAVCFVYHEEEKCFKALQVLGSATHEERYAALQKIDSQTRVQKAEDALEALLEDYDPRSDRTLNEKLMGFSISAEKDSLLKREILENRVSTYLNNNNLDPAALTEEDKKFFEKMGTYKFIAIPLRGHEEQIIGFVYGNNALTGEPIGGQRNDFKMNIALSAGSIVVQKILDEETIRRHEEERRKLEAEQQKKNALATIGIAAAQMAHEIKNPLVSIGGFAKRIIKYSDEIAKTLNEEQMQKLKRINENATIILDEAQRLEQLLDTNLLYASQRQAKPEKINLSEIYNRALVRSNSGDIKIECSHDSESTFAYADAKQVIGIYINLIKNAVDAMKSDSRSDNKLRVRIWAEGNKAYASFTNPQKMPDEKMQKLFEPFITTKENGTGLGITSCKDFAEKNNGTLDCTSNEKDGTTFKVMLPAYTNQNGNKE